MKQEIYKGEIVNFSGSWGSGLGYLKIKDDRTGKEQSIPCENSQTVRSLESCFGNVISEGHCANGEGYKGKVIYWAWDDMGLVLGGFYPEEGEESYAYEEKYQSQFKVAKKSKKKK
jgi:hypothetical protein